MSVEIVHTASKSVNRLAVVTPLDEVWVTFQQPWWHLASWLWWFLSPGKKAWILVSTADGRRVRVRACRVAKNLVRSSGRSAPASPC